MHFLLANDDGIDAPGLAMLAEVAAEFGDVTVVAPDRQFSGCGHQTTTDGHVTVEEVGPRRFAITGTPADCTRLGLMHLADEDVDWVLAGVNHGGNLGIDTAMSGTVAVVREASLFGKPGIAVSQYHRRRADGSMPMDWETVRPKLRAVFERLLTSHPEPGHLWNVNLPDPGDHEPPVPEIVDAPLDLGPLAFDYHVDGDAYTFRGRYHERGRTPGSDVDVCFSGRIALTHLPALVGG